MDLKLGQVIDSSISKMALSPSGLSKRARAINNTIQAATCLVDDCNADLSNCKEYHRCPNSKTPEVSINGQKQRFCQQCSRYVSVALFCLLLLMVCWFFVFGYLFYDFELR